MIKLILLPMVTPTKKQRRAHSQARRRRNPVLQEQEQSADTMRRAIARAREEPGVREHEQSADTVRRAIAREEPGVQEHESFTDCVVLLNQSEALGRLGQQSSSSLKIMRLAED